MADTKISQLPAATALTGAELLVLVQGGTSKQTTTSNLASAPATVGLGVGDWIMDPAVSGTQNVQQSEQELDLIPRLLPAGTFDAVAVNVSVAGSTGAVFRIALYSNVNGAPAALIGQSAAVDATTTGVKLVTLASTFTLSAGGVVWGGVVAQGGATTRATFTRVLGQHLGNRTSTTPTDFVSTNVPNYYTTGVSTTPPSTWTDTRRFDSGARMAFRRSA